MAKPLFVIADTNAEFIAPLEAKLLETFRDNIELEIMDDPEYIEEFVSTARRIDILIVADRLYNSFLRRNEIGMVYKLTEDPAEENLSGNAVRVLYKYAHFMKVFSEIEYGARQFAQKTSAQAQKTRIVMVYSAAGGSGKTTIALGLCVNLVDNHKRVLYIDAENIQDFGYYLQDKAALSPNGSNALGANTGDLYSTLKPCIRNEGFDYLPPLRMAASAMEIDCAVYGKVAKEFQKHVDYDYIIMDTDSVFDSTKDAYMQMADKVVLITGADEFSQYKTSLLMNNFATTDSGKFLRICNQTANASGMMTDSGLPVDAFVSVMPGRITLQSLQMNQDLDKISYLI